MRISTKENPCLCQGSPTIFLRQCPFPYFSLPIPTKTYAQPIMIFQSIDPQHRQLSSIMSGGHLDGWQLMNNQLPMFSCTLWPNCPGPLSLLAHIRNQPPPPQISLSRCFQSHIVYINKLRHLTHFQPAAGGSTYFQNHGNTTHTQTK
jgi:hypothetical protein